MEFLILIKHFFFSEKHKLEINYIKGTYLFKSAKNALINIVTNALNIIAIFKFKIGFLMNYKKMKALTCF